MHSPSPRTASPGHSLPNRRLEDRTPSAGEIILVPDTLRPALIIAKLKDLSSTGFRAAHTSPMFQAGLQVHFRHTEGAGLARVVWSRNSAGHCETGFEILTQ